MSNEQEQEYDLDTDNCQPTKCMQLLGYFYGVCPICQLESAKHAVCPNKEKANEI